MKGVKYLDYKQAAEKLCIKVRTLRNYVSDGRIPEDWIRRLPTGGVRFVEHIIDNWMLENG